MKDLKSLLKELCSQHEDNCVLTFNLLKAGDISFSTLQHSTLCILHSCLNSVCFLTELEHNMFPFIRNDCISLYNDCSTLDNVDKTTCHSFEHA